MAVATPQTMHSRDRTPRTGRWTGEARQVADAVGSITSFVASADPGRFSVTDAVSLVTLMEEGKRRLEAGITLFATRAAMGQAHHLSGHATPEEWLAAVTGSSRGEAKDVLKVGEALASQPGVEDALRGGRLTSQRAKLVTDALKVNPGREEDLLQGAEGDTVGQLKERCQRVKAEGRSKEQSDAHQRRLHENRRCWTFTDRDGAFGITALFAPEAGGRLKAALDLQCDRFFQKARREGRMEPVDAYRADALFALVTGNGLAAGSEKQPGRPDGRRDAQDRTGRPAVAGTGPTGCRPPEPRAHVQVRVDYETLVRGWVTGGEVCEIPGVGPVSVEWARSLLGDALLDLFISDGVDVRTVVRPRRKIPTPLLTAITERDQCCVVPGCGKRKGLEKDHWRRPVKDGGEASYENLVLLCSHHHSLRTHRGWVLTNENGRWQFEPPEQTTPRGTPKRKDPKGKARSGAGPPTRLPESGTAPPLFTDRE